MLDLFYFVCMFVYCNIWSIVGQIFKTVMRRLESFSKLCGTCLELVSHIGCRSFVSKLFSQTRGQPFVLERLLHIGCQRCSKYVHVLYANFCFQNVVHMLDLKLVFETVSDIGCKRVHKLCFRNVFHIFDVKVFI